MSAATAAAVPAYNATQGYALFLGDTALVLAQRLGEWIGHAPALEEDLALANVALDLVGQARHLLTLAGELEGQGRSEDDLAFMRDPQDFTNLTLAEQPNGDFGQTIMRQFLLDAWQLELYEKLQSSSEPRLAEIAAKALKETRYHYRFSAGWVVRLGDGTEESHARMQNALDTLWRFTGELFEPVGPDELAAQAGIAPSPQSLRAGWQANVDAVLAEATLTKPQDVPYRWFGKCGDHTEHLGLMLAEMQYLPRSFPGAQW